MQPIKLVAAAAALLTTLAFAFASAGSPNKGQDIESEEALPPPSPLCSLNAAVTPPFLMPNLGDVPSTISLVPTPDSTEKEVSIAYTARLIDSSGNRVPFKRIVSHPVSYYPMAVAFIGNSKLAVAGMHAASGRPLIEVWTLEYPYLSLDEGPSGAKISFKESRVSKTRLAFYPKGDLGIGLFRSLLRNLGATGESVYATTCQSGDLYHVNLETGVASLVASSSQAVGQLDIQPHLTPSLDSYSGPYRHISLGDLYLFTSRDPDVADQSIIDAVHFWDSDMNGTIDSAVPMSKELELAADLWKRSDWLRIIDLGPNTSFHSNF